MKYQPNPILRSDSYKTSHYKQYPAGAEYVNSYIESRGCDRGWKELVVLGVQAFVKEYLMEPITAEDIDHAEATVTAHGLPFNREGWEIILNDYRGYMPLIVESLPEGTVVGLSEVLVQMRNTDPRLPWLTSYFETALLRAVWYPTTVATQSREIKKTILDELEFTGAKPGAADFMLHDFGARGVSSSESAGIGGMAHMVNFMGSDTLEGIEYAREFYNVTDMPAFSVEAAEHSTVTSWGRENEADMYREMIRNNPGNGAITSIVSDSYDIYNACANIFGEELYDDIIALGERGGRLVVRPDSGDPTVVPVECVRILAGKFGSAENAKGYKVLPDFIRVLQGDGINQGSIETILHNLELEGFAADNMVFGMGGALLQGVNRDTLKFAMKASAICINGQWQDVYKDPITSSSKKSKRGILSYVNGKTTRRDFTSSTPVGDLQFVYVWDAFNAGLWESPKIQNETTLDEIRQRAKIS